MTYLKGRVRGEKVSEEGAIRTWRTKSGNAMRGMMLDGFVVPHGHFRVFHGNPAADSAVNASADHLSMRLNARRVEAAATDLHLREFAQLEAQVKTVQQQATGSTPALVTTAHAAALAECFAFYARLMTVESFTWPDFLTTVFTKLVEHFAASESDIVHSAILHVFQQSRAHVSQVRDSAKMITQLNALLTKELGQHRRIRCLQLLETMPTIVKGDSTLQSTLLAALSATNPTEQAVGIAATRALLHHSSEFQSTVLELVLGSRNLAWCPVLEETIRNEVDATQAWNYCANLYHDQVTDEAAISCLQSAFDIATSYPREMTASTVELFRFVAANDPRRTVVRFAWSTFVQFLDGLSESPISLEEVVTIVVEHLEKTNHLAIRRLALRAMARCGDLGADTSSRLQVARQAVGSDTQCNFQYVKILTSCARLDIRRLSANQDESSKNLDAILQKLSPSQFKTAQKVWECALQCVTNLCAEFPAAAGPVVTECLFELITIAEQEDVKGMRFPLWNALSHVLIQHPARFQDQATNVSKWIELIDADDSKTRQAIAVCFFRGQHVMRDQDTRIIEDALCKTSIPSLSDRYDLAKAAAIHGNMRVATNLLSSIALRIDHECFGGWIGALEHFTMAEHSVVIDQLVSMDTLLRLQEAKSALEAAATASHGFELQQAIVSARMAWMDGMLRVQQFAGETEKTGMVGGYRERLLVGLFGTTAIRFMDIRRKVWGADSSDLDALAIQAKLCILMATAVETLLLLEQPSASLPSPLILSRTSRLTPHLESIEALETSLLDKFQKLSQLNSTRKAAVGAKVELHSRKNKTYDKSSHEILLGTASSHGRICPMI
ncbi:hypothetical protein Poli38472_007636 [Pythium oligandrum]|uniref:Integrator complex subunit 7 N-terminal domain-containing protein n=1 Tax=Pythium oligandrum TaxID=41045 RepID=A0A8K1FP32_PYTOL|nr:hypothetical protein Poli38472_007636 [Pythium oligandrum]|eukprot:TMW67964.1 hypothetical protein Poli38472_007636 [Pythium oligandrum]